MNISGIYKITNIFNGRFYIGSSKDVESRWLRHNFDLHNGKHHCIELQSDFNKYGPQAFEYTLLEYCNQELLHCRERVYFDNSDPDMMYNTAYVIGGGDLLTDHPNREEIIARRTISQNRSISNMTPEQRSEKWGRPGPTNGMYGNTHSPEVRQRLSEASKGNSRAKGAIRSDEQRQLLSELASQRVGELNPFYGKSHTEESKRLMSIANKGKLPPNIREVCIDGISYPSISEASRSLSIPSPTIYYRINSDNPKYSEYKYLN